MKCYICDVDIPNERVKEDSITGKIAPCYTCEQAINELLVEDTHVLDDVTLEEFLESEEDATQIT